MCVAKSSTYAHALFLLAVLPVFVGYRPVVGEVVQVVEDLNAPRFVDGQNTNIYVAVGDVARLTCAVRRVHDKSVLWVRVNDLHILSFDNTVFTADPRVSVKVDNGSYNLNIKKTQVSDSGRYECQINTEPKMSMFFNLTVIDQPMPKLKVWISGPPQQHTPLGHTITFSCEARYVWKNDPPPIINIPLPAINMYWMHEDKLITLQTDRGGILVDTDRSATSATSQLTVADVTSRDEGTYTCVVGQNRDSLVFYLKDDDDDYYNVEQIEAMQRDQAHGGVEKAFLSSLLKSPALVLTFYYLIRLST